MARIRPQPRNVPTASPPTVPKTAVITDSHRTVARQLAAALADRRAQPELTGALVDRQRQRVADPHHGDQHGDGEQPVDHGRASSRSRTRPSPCTPRRLRFGRRVALGDRAHDGEAVGLGHPVGEVDEHDHVTALAGVRGPVVGRHHEIAERHPLGEDHADREVGRGAVDERQRDRVIGGQSVFLRVVLADRDPSGTQVADRALDDAHVEHRIEPAEVGGRRFDVVAVDAGGGEGHADCVIDLGLLGDRAGQFGAQGRAAEAVLFDDQVAAEPVVDGIVDRRLERTSRTW